jgi:hypothetical protein
MPQCQCFHHKSHMDCPVLKVSRLSYPGHIVQSHAKESMEIREFQTFDNTCRSCVTIFDHKHLVFEVQPNNVLTYLNLLHFYLLGYLKTIV